MLKKDELSNPQSCLNLSRDNEMVFVLTGRDPAAPLAIRCWIDERIRIGKNKRDDAQLVEARNCAALMGTDHATAALMGTDHATAAEIVDAAIRALEAVMLSTAVRFCPECGEVGPVADDFVDCCPDGIRHEFVSAKVAKFLFNERNHNVNLRNLIQEIRGLATVSESWSNRVARALGAAG